MISVLVSIFSILSVSGAAEANFDICKLRAQVAVIDLYIAFRPGMSVGIQSSKLLLKSKGVSTYQIIARESADSVSWDFAKYRVTTFTNGSGDCVAEEPVLQN
jgi:hypothetical protein